MGRGTKGCLGCGALVLLLACMVCVAGSVLTPIAASLAMTSLTANLASSADPAKAKRVGAQIADYTLPPGHREQLGVDLWAAQMVVITPDVFNTDVNHSDGYIIDLLATKLPIDSAQLEKQMLEGLLAQTKAQGLSLQKTSERTVTIHGKPVTMNVLEDSPAHPLIRAASGGFRGRDGQTFVQIISQANLWNWTTVETFLRSLQ